MIWVNGEIRSGDDPIIRAQDRGLLIGDGLFETVKVKAGKPVFLTEHLCRLAISARELALPIDRQEVREGVMALLRASPEVVGSVRITLTRGVGPRGLSPSRGQGQTPEIFITTAPESPYLEPKEEMGDRLLMAPHIRVSGAVTSRMKTLSYTDSLVVKGWAETKGAADAIFVNERDEVTCTTMANLFVQMEESLSHPPIKCWGVAGNCQGANCCDGPVGMVLIFVCAISK